MFLKNKDNLKLKKTFTRERGKMVIVLPFKTGSGGKQLEIKGAPLNFEFRK